MLLVVCTSVILLLQSSKPTREAVGAQQMTDTTEESGAASPYLYAVPAPAPLRTSTRATSSTRGSTASKVPEPTKSLDRGVTTDTLRPTSTKKWSKIRNDMLLCVVGRRAVSRKMFPQDGVCTHVFYAHVVLEGNRISDSETNASLATFSAVARDSQRTGYGLSFDFRKSVQSNVAAQTTGGGSTLDDLWQTYKVQHHGILNAVVPFANMDAIVKAELKLIETLHNIHSEQNPSTSYGYKPKDIIIGLNFSDAYLHQDSSRVVRRINDELKVTAILIRTHIPGYDSGTWITGPTAWSGSQTLYWFMTFSVFVVTKERTSITKRILLSFTMSAAKFEIADDLSAVPEDLKIRAKSFTQAGYQQTCEPGYSAPIKKMPERFMYIVNAGTKTILTYDNEETMQEKMNLSFKQLSHPNRGWALFDLEDDDYMDVCKRRAFGRVFAVKDYLN